MARVSERPGRHLPEARQPTPTCASTARRRSCTWTSRPDADPTRLYFAKAFLYPLFAAPFIWVFGTNGFLVLHVLVVLATFLCAYAFLVARSQPIPALLFAGAFVFVSVVPVYLVWLTPDLFNLGLVTLGYFFWLYKEVAPPATPEGRDDRRGWSGRAPI